MSKKKKQLSTKLIKSTKSVEKSKTRVSRDTPPDEPYWSHRVIRTRYPNPVTGKRESRYGVHEAYFDAGKRLPHSWTMHPINVNEGSVKELKLLVDRLLRSLQRPVLDADKLKRRKQRRGKG
jgi:hypothetical protein